MNILDSSELAVAKFKAKKVRSILTALAAGFMLVVLIASSFFVSSIVQAVERQATSQEKILATVSNYDGATVVRPDSAIEEFKYKRMYREIEQIDGISTHGNYEAGDFTTFAGFTAIDDSLFFEEDNGIDLTTGTIPIKVSTDFVIAKEGIQFSTGTPVEERASTISNAQSKYLGRVVTVLLSPSYFEPIPNEGELETGSEDSNLTFTATIIGFKSSSSSLFESYASSEIPFSALKNPELSDLLQTEEDQQSVSMFAFESEEARREYVENCRDTFFNQDCQYYQDPLATIVSLTNDFKSFIRIIVIILASIVASSMFVTVSKIISDSERETGVFRAIGALRRDVAQIYVTYALLLATVAFILALLLATLVSLYLTSRFGASFGYQIAESTGNYTNAGPVTLIGFNARELGSIYLIGVVAALVGATLPILNVLRKDPIKAMRSE